MTKKRFFAALYLYLCISFSVYAQAPTFYRPLSEYDSDETALKDFEEALTKGTYDVIWGNLGLAQYYARVKNDPPKAYQYANAGLERFATLKADQKQNMRKRFVSSTKLKRLRDSAITLIFEQVEAQKSRLAYEKFLEDYPRPKIKSTGITIWNDAMTKRNAFICDEIEDLKTVKPLADLADRYGKELSRFSNDCYNRLQFKLFTTFFTTHSWADLDTFAVQYPKNSYSKDAGRKAFKQAIMVQQVETLEAFKNKYPASLYLEMVLDTLYYLKNKDKYKYGNADGAQRCKQDDFEDLIASIKLFPESPKMMEWDDSLKNMFMRRPSVEYLEKQRPFDLARLPKSEKAIYAFYTSFGSLKHLNTFTSYYTNYKTVKPDSDKVVVALYDRQPLEFIQKMPHTYRAYEWLQNRIASKIRDKNWTAALDTVIKYAPLFGKNDDRINDLLAVLSDPLSKIQTSKVSNGISTGSSEYCPIITPDGKTLFFCRQVGSESIYTAHKKMFTWQDPAQIKGLQQGGFNFAPQTVFDNAKKLIVFKSGQLVFLEKTLTGNWREKEALPPCINTYRWQANSTLNKDETVMLFESKDRPDLVGEQNGYDNIDFFMSFKNAKGEWSKSVNMGSVINTPFEERSPYLHHDGKTLYFCSKGHGGLGDMDLYKSIRLDDTWLNWSTPINVGKDINSTGTENGYSITADGKQAYFSKDYDIWMATNLPKRMAPSVPIPIVSIQLTGLSQKPPKQMNWLVIDRKTRDTLDIVSSDENGELTVMLPDSSAYDIVPQDTTSGFLPTSIKIDKPSIAAEDTISQTVTLIKAVEVTEKGVNVVAKNIYFAVGKADILPESAEELKRWADILKEHEFKAVVEGHTDDVGKDEDNLLLSQKRATAVRAYLIELGCDENKTSAIGYGETRFKTDNLTPEGKAQNRRVEIKLMREE